MKNDTNNKCCATCKFNKRIEILDYTNGGCVHSKPQGFACIVFLDEGTVNHMIGLDVNIGICECYIKKE